MLLLKRDSEWRLDRASYWITSRPTFQLVHAPGECVEVYVADVGWLVVEACPPAEMVRVHLCVCVSL